MRIVKKLLAALLSGAGLAAVVILLSQLVLRHLGDIVGWIGGIAGMKASDLELFTQIFAQLRDAAIVSPWIPALLIGCALNAAVAYIIHSGKFRHVVININFVLLIPAVAAALWFTSVNGIMLGDMIRQLIPILESGLL